MKNADYCGIIIMLRQLVNNGVLSKKEAGKVSARIATQLGADIIIPL